jgi:predicted nucleic acid-binding protein
MQSPSILKPNSAPIFLDTSVLINMVAANCVETMGEALRRPLYIESYVAAELRHDPRTGNAGTAVLEQLVKKNAIQIVTLTEEQMVHFLNLVGAPLPDDLGDGEAATLACSLDHGFAAIDERKAQRIASRDYANLTVLTTLDLMCSPQAFSHVGADGVREAVTHALNFGRMRVPHKWKSWVKALMA